MKFEIFRLFKSSMQLGLSAIMPSDYQTTERSTHFEDIYNKTVHFVGVSDEQRDSLYTIYNPRCLKNWIIYFFIMLLVLLCIAAFVFLVNLVTYKFSHLHLSNTEFAKPRSREKRKRKYKKLSIKEEENSEIV